MNTIPRDFVLSVVIPVYNEERTLAKLVDAVRAVPIRKQIILVDDCSKDGSRSVMEGFSDDERNTFAKLHHDVNKGKGAALRTGFAAATGDAVIIQSAEIGKRRDDSGSEEGQKRGEKKRPEASHRHAMPSVRLMLASAAPAARG